MNVEEVSGVAALQEETVLAFSNSRNSRRDFLFRGLEGTVKKRTMSGICTGNHGELKKF